MAKLTLSNVTSGYQSTIVQNSNNDLIEAEFEKVLYRNDDSGEFSPLSQDIDMNSKQIINLQAGTLASDGINKGQLDAAKNATLTAVDAINVDYTVIGVGAVQRTVKASLDDLGLNVKSFGATGDGSTDDTINIAKAFTAGVAQGLAVVVPGDIYIVENLEVPANCKIIMVGNPTFKIKTGQLTNRVSALKIVGNNVTIEGEFTCDGDIANNKATIVFNSNLIDGTFQISADNFTATGLININNAAGAAVSCWNDVDTNGGDTPRFIQIPLGFNIVNTPSHSAYWWSVKNFSIGDINQTDGPETSLYQDSRWRTGTQNSSTLECREGHIGQVKGCTLIVESRSYGLHIESIHKTGSKIDNGNDITIDRIIMVGGPLGVAQGFNISNEFSAIGTSNIKIGLLHIEDATGDGSSIAFSIGGTADPEDITFDKIFIKNSSSVSSQMRIRNGKRMYFHDVTLIGGGVADKGLIEEGGHPREDVRINRLHTSGHISNDIQMNAREIQIDHLNQSAVRSGDVYVNQTDAIPVNKGATVGTAGDFVTLAEAIQFATETYQPTLLTSLLTNGRFIITLQSTYIWNEAIVIDGIDLGWITIKTDASVTTVCTGIKCMRVIRGGVAPFIQGDYDKNSTVDSFLVVEDVSRGSFDGTIIELNAFAIDAQKGGTIALSAATVLTKAAAAAASATAVVATGSGIISCQNATVSYSTVFDGGIICLGGSGTSTGGTSQTVNTLTAEGIIYN